MSEWISVKERFPQSRQKCLFFTGKMEISFGFFIKETLPVIDWATDTSINFVDLSNDETGTATHWMPLPEPPK